MVKAVLAGVLCTLAAATALGNDKGSPQAAVQPFEVAPGLTVDVQRLPAGPQAPRGATPIYFIAGGPAVAPSEELARRPALFAQLQTLGEVVLVGQRGAGNSRPPMGCDTRWALPLDRVPTRAEVVADARRQFVACASTLRSRGVDLAAYRTEAYAADLQSVMRALGHPRVRLVAHSYGTMIALELLRLEPSRVDRAVLAGVMGPGDALRDPGHHERVLNTLAQSKALDTTTLRAQVAKALARIEREPSSAHTSDGVAVLLGRDDVARGLVQTLGRPAQAQRVLAVIEALAAERPDAASDAQQALGAWLVEVAEGTRTARTGPLSQRAAAQHYLTVCANGEPDERRLARSGSSLFGHQLHAALPDACEGWGLTPAAARGPVNASLPVLIVSALLDVRTPHEQALAAQRTLPRTTLLTLAGAGHGEVLGPHPGLEARLLGFLRAEPVASATLAASP